MKCLLLASAFLSVVSAADPVCSQDVYALLALMSNYAPAREYCSKHYTTTVTAAASDNSKREFSVYTIPSIRTITIKTLHTTTAVVPSIAAETTPAAGDATTQVTGDPVATSQQTPTTVVRRSAAATAPVAVAPAEQKSSATTSNIDGYPLTVPTITPEDVLMSSLLSGFGSRASTFCSCIGAQATVSPQNKSRKRNIIANSFSSGGGKSSGNYSQCHHHQ